MAMKKNRMILDKCYAYRYNLFYKIVSKEVLCHGIKARSKTNCKIYR